MEQHISIAYQVKMEQVELDGASETIQSNSRSHPDSSPLTLYIKSSRHHLHCI